MGRTTETRMKGKVVAYQVSYLPRKVDTYSDGVTVTRSRKLGAMVTIQVDGKKYTTMAKKTSALLDRDGESVDPTPDLCKTIINKLVEANPINSDREFVELVTHHEGSRQTRRYELIE